MNAEWLKEIDDICIRRLQLQNQLDTEARRMKELEVLLKLGPNEAMA